MLTRPVVEWAQQTIFESIRLRMKDGSVFQVSIKCISTNEVVNVTVIAHTEQLALRSKHDFHCSVLESSLDEKTRRLLDSMLTKDPDKLDLDLHTVRVLMKDRQTDYKKLISATERLTINPKNQLLQDLHYLMMQQNMKGMVRRSFANLGEGDSAETKSKLHATLAKAKQEVIKKGALGHKLFKCQIDAIHVCDYFRARANVIHGPPGTGKTMVQSLCAIVYLKADVRVLLMAPTNDTVENSVESILPHLDHHGLLRDPDFILVIGQSTIYQGHQLRALRREADNVKAAEDDALNQGQDIDEVNVDFENELYAYREYHRQSDGNFRSDDYVNFTLLAHTIRTAFKNQCVLLAAYPTWNAETKKFMSDVDKAKANITAPETELDMYREVRKLAWIDQKECSDLERAQRRHAFKVCGDDIMSIANVLVATSTTAMSKQYQEFGKNRPVVAFFDEAAKEFEIRVSQAFVNIKHGENIRGITLIGDHYQSKPVWISATGSPMLNEFVKQGRLSLLARFFRNSFPAISLDTSTRSDEHIINFANTFTYGHRLEYAELPGGPERTLEPYLAIQKITGPKFYGFTAAHNNPKALFGLNNPLGETCMDSTSSRYCMDDVKLIVMIVKLLFEECPAVLAHLTIQTPYNAQAIKIRQGLRRLCKILLGNPRMESLGLKVGTFDNFHGKQDLYVITSLTNTDSLGFLIEDDMINTAITRARHIHCVVANLKILNKGWAVK